MICLSCVRGVLVLGEFASVYEITLSKALLLSSRCCPSRTSETPVPGCRGSQRQAVPCQVPRLGQVPEKPVPPPPHQVTSRYFFSQLEDIQKGGWEEISLKSAPGRQFRKCSPFAPALLEKDLAASGGSGSQHLYGTEGPLRVTANLYDFAPQKSPSPTHSLMSGFRVFRGFLKPTHEPQVVSKQDDLRWYVEKERLTF